MVPDGTDDEGETDGTPGERAASVEEVDRIARELAERGEPFARATVVRREPPVSATPGDRAVITVDGELTGWIGGVECAQTAVVREATEAIRTGEARLVGLAPDPADIERPGLEAFPMTCHSGGTLEVFVEPVVPAPRLAIVGGSPIAGALARLAADLAFEVVVVDPGGGEYPGADAVVSAFDPDEMATDGGGPYVVVATMGEDDGEAVATAVGLGAPYIGLVASERRAAGVVDDVAAALALDREAVREAVTSPAGVDIGAGTPEEIALSILAEVVAVRRSGDDGGHVVADRSEEQDGEVATDPVCGMDVWVADPSATVDHGGTTYYFCCADCADRFRGNPAEFVEA